jgi:hypothetical protein
VVRCRGKLSYDDVVLGYNNMCAGLLTDSCEHRDGNGYPRPDIRWVFTPLGFVCGLNIESRLEGG